MLSPMPVRYTVTVISKSFDAPVVANFAHRTDAAKALRGASMYPDFIRGTLVRIESGEVLRKLGR